MKKILILFCLYLCLCLHLSQGRQPCKPGYFVWGGKYCFKVSSVKSSWKEAEDSCSRDGGYLSSVHSSAEMKFIRILMLIKRARKMYLGLYRDPNHDLFLNQDETESDFFQWKNGNPPYSKTKKCVTVSMSDGNRWSAEDCNERLQYLCKTYITPRSRVKRRKRQRCHVCYNAASNEECNSKISRTCSEYENTCQNEVRTSGGRTLISKRCKQQVACENDYQQNTKAAWMVAQCSSTFTTNSVCRCCCKGEMCNEAELPCIGDTSCKALSVPSNAFLKCNNGQNSGSICTFQCALGYRLIGGNRRQCIGQTQQWSGSSPTCENVVCPDRKTDLVNGNVRCSDQNSFGSRCTYTCNQNYTLNGASQVSCLSTGRWSSDAPTCRLITCPEPRTVRNGRQISSRENQIGSTRQYACNQGYTFRGSDVITCLDLNNDRRGEWNGRPICERIQCLAEIQPPENGDVVTDDKFYGSEITYNCNARYYMDGNSTGECVDTNNDGVGEWSISTPSCKAITCVELSPPQFGILDGTSPFLVDDQISVTCDPGYFLVGESTLRCLDDDRDANGIWDKALPVCEEIVCNTISNPINGQVSANSLPSWGTRVNFTCSEGYFLEGESSLQCGDNNNDGTGDWNNNEPICNLIRCPALTIPVNGRSAAPLQTRYGSVVRFLCDEGYYVIGSANLTCEDYNNDEVGDWDDSTPFCERIVCREILPTPRNGQILFFPENTAFYGSTYEFACDVGYFLIGSDVITCGDNNNDNDGDWLQDIPVCRQILCPELVAPRNGFFASISSLEFGETLEVECHDGFYLIGNSSLTCIDLNTDGRGDWNSILPVCEQISCSSSDVQAPENGNVEFPTSTIWGSTATFTCDEGYFLVGESQRVCRDSNDDGAGDWSGNSSMCERVLCPVLPEPENGLYVPADVTFGTEVTYICNEGFFLRGSSVLQCTDIENNDAVGEWSNNPPFCEQIVCPVISSPLNGDVVGIGNAVSRARQQIWGTRATFICDPGYFLDGVSVIQCVDNLNDGVGEWSNPEPSCTLIECPSLGPILSGAYVMSDDVFRIGTSVTIQCDEGYHETYNGDVICRNTTNSPVGEWIGVLPTCEQILCNDISRDPPNGVVACSDFNLFGSLCVFQCERGYFLNGSNSTVCMDLDENGQGEWSTEVPVCQKITCDPGLSNPENGVVDCTLENEFSSECHFSCENGFFLKGNDILVCGGGDRNGNGTWSQEAPICGQINCEPQNSPANGGVSCSDGNKYGSRCIFECDIGHSVIGFDTVSCGEPTADSTGRWNGDPVFCEMNQCEIPSENPVNGTYECTNSNFYGSECNYSCAEGYFLIGTQTRSCLANRRWSEEEPTCEIQRCKPLPENPTDGLVFCTDEDKYGSICSYFCDLGFELLGSATTTCMADTNGDNFGEFNNPPPFCEPIYCPDIEGKIDGGAVICAIGSDELEGNRYGSECVLICDDGYRAQGDRRAICLGKGVWTRTIGTCQRYRCFPPLPIPRFGSKLCTTRDDSIGTVCRFSCNRSTLVGVSDQVTCLANGSWDLAPPTCSRP